QLARRVGGHAVFEIRHPDRPDQYPIFSQACIAAAGVEKSESVAHDLRDATKLPMAEKAANDGCSVGLKSQRHLPQPRARPSEETRTLARQTFPGHDGRITSAIAAALLWKSCVLQYPSAAHRGSFYYTMRPRVPRRGTSAPHG